MEAADSTLPDPPPPPTRIRGWIVIDTTVPGIEGAIINTMSPTEQGALVKFMESAGVIGGGLTWTYWNKLGYELRPMVFLGEVWPDGKVKNPNKKKQGRPLGSADRKPRKKPSWV